MYSRQELVHVDEKRASCDTRGGPSRTMGTEKARAVKNGSVSANVSGTKKSTWFPLAGTAPPNPRVASTRTFSWEDVRDIICGGKMLGERHGLRHGTRALSY